MRILVLSVGRPDRGPYGSLFEDYASRIRRFHIDFEARHAPEVEAGGRYTDDHVREREARGLTAALPPRARVIALDPSGAPLTSEQLAARLEAWATPLAAFVVGGPLGLDRAWRGKAAFVLALSAMTLPHDLARVVLAEQIFRALTILRGVPYHK
ncbi:MAG TPA: 23S rRNA (pseudouridine(1915)-N(3))-methyltransferase RlmH [Candidatus Polarisedimenticolaceae bacterium]|nr:23S rRNA (pseudouridine(1915)-N(3))-methyltransferase RlmH [Candidatus Polarisedimenticolaceae bacterium]